MKHCCQYFNVRVLHCCQYLNVRVLHCCVTTKQASDLDRFAIVVMQRGQGDA
jgi:hypothetical protein